MIKILGRAFARSNQGQFKYKFLLFFVFLSFFCINSAKASEVIWIQPNEDSYWDLDDYGIIQSITPTVTATSINFSIYTLASNALHDMYGKICIVQGQYNNTPLDCSDEFHITSGTYGHETIVPYSYNFIKDNVYYINIYRTSGYTDFGILSKQDFGDIIPGFLTYYSGGWQDTIEDVQMTITGEIPVAEAGYITNLNNIMSAVNYVATELLVNVLNNFWGYLLIIGIIIAFIGHFRKFILKIVKK